MSYPTDRKYTKEHEWITADGTVGITKYAQDSLGDIVFVELPKVGSEITARKPFGTVESVKAVSDVYAPVSGEVNKTVVVGLNIQPGQQLLTVVPLNEVWVTANFKETQLRRMRVGQRAELHIDSSGKTLKGHVDSIAGATGPLFSLLPPENATGNYVKIVQRIPVKIVVDPGENQDRRLRPGMNVEPDVYLQ